LNLLSKPSVTHVVSATAIIFCCRWSIFKGSVGEWPQNQILIPDWTYFHCPAATLTIVCRNDNLFALANHHRLDPENQQQKKEEALSSFA